MFFKNVTGLEPSFHCDILTGKTVQWHSSFPEAISHGGSLKTTLIPIRLRGFIYLAVLGSCIIDWWALKMDPAWTEAHWDTSRPQRGLVTIGQVL